MPFQFNPTTCQLDLVGSATGDVKGPGSSTDKAIARFNGATGKLLQDSVVTVSDAGAVSGVTTLSAANVNVSSGTASTAAILDAGKNVASSVTTSTELGYVSGVTSSIQPQIDAKIPLTQRGAANGVATLDSGGLIPITQIPPSALERLVVVADQPARFALTTATVQNGDTVKQTDTNVMYFVVDQTNLGNSAGYSVYNAGTAAAVAWTGITGVPAPVSALLGTNTGDISIGTFGSAPAANGATLVGQVLTIQPADGTHPGAITSGAQTIGGAKTFSSTISASNLSGTNTGDQTITLTSDVTGSGTGSFAATVANVGGQTAATVAAGAVLANAATNTNTASTIVRRDANKNTVINNLIEGFATTTTAAGTTTLAVSSAYLQQFTGTTTQTVVMPDATTLALGQSFSVLNRSTGAVTVNANGGGLLGTVAASAQTTFTVTSIGTTAGTWDVAASTAAPAWGSITGIPAPVSALLGTNTGDQTITLTGVVTGSGTGSFATTIPANQVTNAMLAQAAANTLKGNNTAGTANVTDLTATQIRALLGIVSGSPGDIGETSFSAANNQAVAANITGFAFANATVRGFESLVSVFINATTPKYATYRLVGIQKASTWELDQSFVGDGSTAGITFSITSAGQIQYTSTNATGFVSNTIKFRANTVSV